MDTASILIGLAIGAFVTVPLTLLAMNGQMVKLRDEARDEREQATKDAVRRSSATVKGQIGERFAPFEGGFGYEPADARFIGSPIDYVVFDGMTDGQIRSIAFVEVKVGALPLSPFQRQVEQAVAANKVRWRVVELADPTAGPRGESNSP